MPRYTTEAIRNIALVGHGGAGKTTLAEALLNRAGAIATPGSVEKGSTVSDFDPREKAHRHSLHAAVMHFEHGGVHVNLLDTPGYPDFVGRALAVLPAVETVAVVINAQRGPELVARRMMAWAAGRGLDRLLIVNQIDAEGVDPARCLEELRAAFGTECLPINLPARRGAAVVDCFFEPSGEATDFSSVAEAHTKLVDQVVEVDEKLMEIYLEQGQEIAPAQLHDPFEKALREGHLVPVCFVSARTGAGVGELLDVFARLMPNPTEGNPPPFLKGEGPTAERVRVSGSARDHVLAHVVKVSIDPFVGRLGVFRIHQGTIGRDTQLFVGDGRKPFKVAHLFKVQGRETREVDAGIPGDICAVSKVDEVHFDAVLHDSHDEDHFHLQSLSLPAPMHGVAVVARARGDEQKISDALHRIEAEDPSVRIEHNHAVNETVIRGLGELHLRMVLEDLKDRFHVEIDARPPRIAYRETITAPAEGHHRHKKQTGGAGQFGEVFLTVEPLPRGAGFEFVDEVVGGVIPRQFIPAVEKGVRQALQEGVLAGYPLQDVRVRVQDGKHHPVDSKEIAFVTAGRRAFVDAVRKAHPAVLEPIVNIEVIVPPERMGDVTGDLSGRRGRINDSTVLADGRAAIRALVPLSGIGGYQAHLNSMTGGAGSYGIEFSHYDPVPARVQQELVAAYKPHADADD
ncbi:MAG: elongation factor G [Gammaproteobacteria bacterium]